MDLGVTHLTLFSFSSENWSRPKQEINDLFGLLRRFVRRDLADLHKNGVKIRVIGARAGLEDDILRMLDDAVELTKDNTALTLTIAFNYGARDEIARAAQHIAEDVKAGTLAAADVTPECFAAYLDTPTCPIRIFSSAPAASCVSRTSSYGSWPIASSSLSTSTGPISPRSCSKLPSPSISGETAASAEPRRDPPRDANTQRPRETIRTQQQTSARCRSSCCRSASRPSSLPPSRLAPSLPAPGAFSRSWSSPADFSPGSGARSPAATASTAPP